MINFRRQACFNTSIQNIVAYKIMSNPRSLTWENYINISFSKWIDVDQAKLEVIEKLPPTTNVKGASSFLGHVGFYRRFIQVFLKITKPLWIFLMKENDFKFDANYLKYF
jgi:hypothetical protein